MGAVIVPLSLEFSATIIAGRRTFAALKSSCGSRCRPGDVALGIAATLIWHYTWMRRWWIAVDSFE